MEDLNCGNRNMRRYFRNHINRILFLVTALILTLSQVCMAQAAQTDQEKKMKEQWVQTALARELLAGYDLLDHIPEDAPWLVRVNQGTCTVTVYRVLQVEKEKIPFYEGVDSIVKNAEEEAQEAAREREERSLDSAFDKTSKSGNGVIMGRQGSGKTRLAEGLILMTCMHLNIKAAKVAHIVAEEFNKKDPAQVVQRMAGGFLIIEAAGALKDEVIDKLNQAMEFRTDDLIVILEDEKADMKQLLDKHPAFAEKFTSRITVPVFTNDELVTFARTYAKEEGYKFDEMATLALYTMIGDNQRDTEPMTVGKVRELVDKAIERNSRKLFGKTTDKEDGRIVLMEKDFNF